eukprot:TRINITY_DN4067_c0_g2_i1.p1 TRINITY_DN4067_c0_g2~~TRINITY_DN4067_c0_g2_i1.p1  ORF type:complete len:481 (+),score=214.80 TRINITY_DN4067_c0_g2_i1:79-1443(+)
MENLDMTWFMALFLFAGMGAYFLLANNRPPPPVIVGRDVAYTGQKLKKDKNAGKGKKKGKAKDAAAAEPAGSGSDGGGAEEEEATSASPAESSSPASSPTTKKKNKVTTLKKNVKEVLREKADAAIRDGAEEDEEGFQTMVSKRDKENKKRLAAMAPEDAREWKRKAAAAEDEKWSIAGPSRAVKGGNAYAGLSAGHVPNVVGRKVPKKKEGRTVNLSPEEIAAKLKKFDGKAQELSTVRCGFNLSVQGTWYPCSDLIATNDFGHAPQLLKCHALNPSTCVAMLKVNIGGKDWMNETVGDEPWLVSGWYAPLTKLVAKAATEVDATVFWQADAGFPDAAVRLVSPAASSETLQLSYVRASPQLSTAVMKIDFKAFAVDFLAASKDLLSVVEKLWAAVEVLEAKHQAQMEANPERAEKMLTGLAEVRTKLPAAEKLERSLHALEDAVAERWPEAV